MSNFKKIFLDLDGPLLDGKKKHYYCYRVILEKFNFTPIGIDEYWEKKRALVNRRDLLNISCAGEIYESFLAEWMEMIESPEALDLDEMQEGAVDCLLGWKSQGAELILVTMRKNKQALNEQLNLMGLRQYLDTIIVCDHDEGGKGKANAVKKKYSIKQLDRHLLWIGDTEADWEAANSLGCAIILLSNGLRNEAYLNSLNGAVVAPSISSLRKIVSGRFNAS
jgi:phosphoglycolate phosphatase